MLNPSAQGALDAQAQLIAEAGVGGKVKMKSRWVFECYGTDGEKKWEDGFDNIVVNVGLDDLLDKYFKGSAYTAAHYVGLVGAGTGTVAITSGANSVTGTSTSFTAADVGSDIIIVGAGAAGADLKTTVATFTSATAITTTANAGTTVSGAGYAVEPRPADTMAAKSFNENTTYSNANRPTLTLGTVASQSVDNSAAKAAFNVNGSTRVYGGFVATNNTKGGTTGTLYGGGLFTTSRTVENGDTLNVTVTLTAASA